MYTLILEMADGSTHREQYLDSYADHAHREHGLAVRFHSFRGRTVKQARLTGSDGYEYPAPRF